jgi:hypothetical protein
VAKGLVVAADDDPSEGAGKGVHLLLPLCDGLQLIFEIMLAAANMKIDAGDPILPFVLEPAVAYAFSVVPLVQSRQSVEAQVSRRVRQDQISIAGRSDASGAVQTVSSLPTSSESMVQRSFGATVVSWDAQDLLCQAPVPT